MSEYRVPCVGGHVNGMYVRVDDRTPPPLNITVPLNMGLAVSGNLDGVQRETVGVSLCSVAGPTRLYRLAFIPADE